MNQRFIYYIYWEKFTCYLHFSLRRESAAESSLCFGSCKKAEEENVETTAIITEKPTTPQLPSRLFCESCGRAKVTIPRIVGGTVASIREYPWLVFLHMRTSDDSFTCGGSLITRDYVLTAAHCVYGPLDSIYVYPFAHQYPDLESNDEYRIASAQVIVHENYDDLEKRNDIALVKLKEPVSFGRNVSSACLANDDDMHTLAVVAGWGRLTHDDPLAIPEQLMEVALEISDQEDCRSIYEGTVDITENMLCTHTPGKDACVGDSGGPLLIEAGPNSWVQIGVVSFGAGCAGDAPGVYTRVSKYVDWIKSHVQKPNC
ncbi:chymotrypsin-like protease CTRL-1 [Macrobrachium nipponense]|uniref:chymotrypsin-like protease CTRL-1 n=1 Tax=Macrobrachium nipponense TaxID=159736 RepID=UPI0030C879FC